MQSELCEQPSTSCRVASTLEAEQKAAEAMPETTSLPNEGFFILLSITLNEHKVFETTERVGLESHTKESRAFYETTTAVDVVEQAHALGSNTFRARPRAFYFRANFQATF